jgi:hypothetical protein
VWVELGVLEQLGDGRWSLTVTVGPPLSGTALKQPPGPSVSLGTRQRGVLGERGADLLLSPQAQIWLQPPRPPRLCHHARPPDQGPSCSGTPAPRLIPSWPPADSIILLAICFRG